MHTPQALAKLDGEVQTHLFSVVLQAVSGGHFRQEKFELSQTVQQETQTLFWFKKGVSLGQLHNFVRGSTTNPEGQRRHFNDSSFQKAGVSHETHSPRESVYFFSGGQMHLFAEVDQILPFRQLRHSNLLLSHTVLQATQVLEASRKGVSLGQLHNFVRVSTTNPDGQRRHFNDSSFQNAGASHETHSPRESVYFFSGGQMHLFAEVDQIVPFKQLKHSNFLLSHIVLQATQVLEASRKGVSLGQLHNFVNGSTMNPVGQRRHFNYAVFQKAGASHEIHSPQESVKFFYGGQMHLLAEVDQILPFRQLRHSNLLLSHTVLQATHLLEASRKGVSVGHEHTFNVWLKMKPDGHLQHLASSWDQNAGAEQRMQDPLARR